MENVPHTDRDGALEMMQRLGDAFAGGLASSLSEHLGAAVRISALGAEQLPYHHFLLALEPATCLAVLRVDPPGAQACVDIPLQVMRPMVAQLLGGVGSTAPGAAMTDLERGMALQIVNRIAAQLVQSAWRVAGVELGVHEESLESSPQ